MAHCVTMTPPLAPPAALGYAGSVGDSNPIPQNSRRKRPGWPGSGSLRGRILAFVSALVLLSLLGSTVSLYQITEVSRGLDAVNRVAIPLARLLVQLESDGEIFRREMRRRLGYSY